MVVGCWLLVLVIELLVLVFQSMVRNKLINYDRKLIDRNYLTKPTA